MSRKLDAALAEALGYEVIWVPVKRYSIDGEPMLDLEEEMRARGFVFWVSGHIDGAYKFAADCFYPEATLHDAVIDGSIKERMVFADTMPEAVALAAYRALTGKEWVE